MKTLQTTTDQYNKVRLDLDMRISLFKKEISIREAKLLESLSGIETPEKIKEIMHGIKTALAKTFRIEKRDVIDAYKSANKEHREAKENKEELLCKEAQKENPTETTNG
jgi:hypothetical protein